MLHPFSFDKTETYYEQPAADDEWVEPPTRPQARQQTILVADDERAIRTLLAKLLTLEGYAVLQAADGQEALLLAQQYLEPIKLLLTDVEMPGLAGPEAARRLLQHRPDMKVLFMSGHPRNDLHRHGVPDRATVLPKPFSRSGLLDQVRRLLEAS